MSKDQRVIAWQFLDRDLPCAECGIAPCFRIVDDVPLHRICDSITLLELEAERRAQQEFLQRPRRKKSGSSP